jgi:serine/threonine protein kinase
MLLGYSQKAPEMIGRTVSHYRILGALGSGGMGVVYLAEDERLGRQVALKFLPATWSKERKALERFRLEARAASSLSHPAICAIYDIGDHEDTPFIVMEALKGETLRERILKGPIKVPDVLDIGIQLADALAAAHAQGIVHRDIKPANIFLGEKNRVKVLDFGLAKLMTAPSSLSSGADTASPMSVRVTPDQITVPGTALGTVSYMSPEQARGEDIDARTDLFSLGAVFYEMVTGVQAFGGSTTAVVYDAILNRAPRSIAHLNPLVPPRLEAVIATLLEKDRDLRYQHASDLEAELKRIRRDIDSALLLSSQGATSSAQAATPTPAPAPTRKPRSWAVPVGVATLVVVLAGAWLWRSQSTPVTAPPETSATPPDAAAPAPQAPPPAVVDVTPAPVPAAPERPAARASERAAPPTPVPTPSSRDARGPQPVPEPRRASAQVEPPPPAAAPSQALPPSPVEPSQALPPPTPTPVPNPRSTVPETARETTLPAPPATTATTPPSPAGAAAAPPPNTATPVATTPSAPVPATTAAPPPAPVSTPPSARAAQAEPVTPSVPASSPVENDEAAIRRLIRQYEQAIETKDLTLYRSIWPRLSPRAEATIRDSFREVDSQQVDIRVERLRVDGRTATAQIARRDVLVTRGRRQTQNSTQTLRFEKTDAGWVITE